MLPGSDIGGMSSSLGARRPAASNLPALTELPPPPIAQLHNKYQAYGALNSSSQPAMHGNSVTSLGNLLTPPNSVPGEPTSASALSPVSAAPTYPSFQSQQANNYWANALPAATQYGPYHSGGAQQQWIPPRGMFSPTSLDTLVRSSNGMMQPQQYELTQLPPFSSNLAMSAPVTLPAMSASQQMHSMNGAYMGAQHTGSTSTLISPLHGQDTFVSRAPSTPSYFSHVQQSPNTQSPSNFPYSNGPAPAPSNSVSPTTTTMDQSLTRTTSLPTTTSQTSAIYQRPSFGAYTSPTSMTGPMMSNMHGAQGQMAMMGNISNGTMGSYNSSHAANLQNLYNSQQSQQTPHQQHHQEHQPQQQHQVHQQSQVTVQNPTPQHPTPTDRPFKCDSCPQSFNRNHDLKRHKRIHLAVKPYPCGHCEKSFSRKDALKRHILVKGCGKISHERMSNDSKSESLSPTTIPLSGIPLSSTVSAPA